jgi:hypothetical protein
MMLRREARVLTVAIVLAVPILIGGIFHSRSVNVSWVVANEAGRLPYLLHSRRPIVISSLSRAGKLTRRKVLWPSRRYLAVYDAGGHLLRWEEGDTFFIRHSTRGCFVSLSGESYSKRVYLPLLPTAGVRGARERHLANGNIRVTWQTPSTETGRWRFNVLLTGPNLKTVYRYHFNGAGAGAPQNSGTFVFSYPHTVTLEPEPSSDLCG